MDSMEHISQGNNLFWNNLETITRFNPDTRKITKWLYVITSSFLHLKETKWYAFNNQYLNNLAGITLPFRS